ncbi:SLAM family member 6-like [Poeciliopsis prolifica]|uniref:SLAM family member 6-like n=1 Tax=Poeciliopsis prolifica TaxID=188132 RepID=UPI00241429D6|nr:SLAM family member 6-like [Poeciliopsis prolifica]
MLFSPRGLQSVWLLLAVLGLGRHDVEASEGKRFIHKKVGDSVELSSNLPAEGIARADWSYGGMKVAIKGSGLTGNNPFKGRSTFNNTTFSFTIRGLTLQDSGQFIFNAEVKGQQRPVVITLQVQEPISTTPIVFSNITEPGSDGSCSVFLECKVNNHSNVIYSWTVETQTRNGPRLQYKITPQDGNTTFTCNASNVISEVSASKILKCSSIDGCGFSPAMFWVRLAVGLLVVLVLVWLLYEPKLKEVLCSGLKRATGVDQDPSELELNSSAPRCKRPTSKFPSAIGTVNGEQVDEMSPGNPSEKFLLRPQSVVEDGSSFNRKNQNPKDWGSGSSC